MVSPNVTQLMSWTHHTIGGGNAHRFLVTLVQQVPAARPSQRRRTVRWRAAAHTRQWCRPPCPAQSRPGAWGSTTRCASGRASASGRAAHSSKSRPPPCDVVVRGRAEENGELNVVAPHRKAPAAGRQRKLGEVRRALQRRARHDVRCSVPGTIVSLSVSQGRALATRPRLTWNDAAHEFGLLFARVLVAPVHDRHLQHPPRSHTQQGTESAARGRGAPRHPQCRPWPGTRSAWP
jgi:hypothetical protein